MVNPFRNATTTYVITAVWFTHGVVPPSAAILAVAILLGADVGMVILWGLVICLAALLIIYAVTIRWMTEHAGRHHYPDSDEWKDQG